MAGQDEVMLSATAMCQTVMFVQTADIRTRTRARQLRAGQQRRAGQAGREGQDRLARQGKAGPEMQGF